MRGGELLPDGKPNPMPRRNLPWGKPWHNAEAQWRAQLYAENERGIIGVADVGTHLGDISPYGVLDLTGNVQEWTSTRGDGDGIRLVRGGSIAALKETTENIVDYMAIENPRAESASGQFELGMRCALND
jgi:formylglycine-generating enzyme required for sulfatase activity